MEVIIYMITNCIIFVLGICDRNGFASLLLQCWNKTFKFCNDKYFSWAKYIRSLSSNSFLHTWIFIEITSTDPVYMVAMYILHGYSMHVYLPKNN